MSNQDSDTRSLPLWSFLFFSLLFFKKVIGGDRHFFARCREAPRFLSAVLGRAVARHVELGDHGVVHDAIDRCGRGHRAQEAAGC